MSAPQNRLARMLHVLLHIHLHDGAATSETIGKLLGAHPVVVRRELADLREAGLLETSRGPGGGWRVAKPLKAIFVADVFLALGGSDAFTPVDVEHPRCPVERVVRTNLDEIQRDAHRQVLAAYERISLEDLAERVRETNRR